MVRSHVAILDSKQISMELIVKVCFFLLSSVYLHFFSLLSPSFFFLSPSWFAYFSFHLPFFSVLFSRYSVKIFSCLNQKKEETQILVSLSFFFWVSFSIAISFFLFISFFWYFLFRPFLRLPIPKFWFFRYQWMSCWS